MGRRSFGPLLPTSALSAAPTLASVGPPDAQVQAQPRAPARVRGWHPIQMLGLGEWPEPHPVPPSPRPWLPKHARPWPPTGGLQDWTPDAAAPRALHFRAHTVPVHQRKRGRAAASCLPEAAPFLLTLSSTWTVTRLQPELLPLYSLDGGQIPARCGTTALREPRLPTAAPSPPAISPPVSPTGGLE